LEEYTPEYSISKVSENNVVRLRWGESNSRFSFMQAYDNNIPCVIDQLVFMLLHTSLIFAALAIKT
jgi:hypothetical protein